MSPLSLEFILCISCKECIQKQSYIFNTYYFTVSIYGLISYRTEPTATDILFTVVEFQWLDNRY
jgi:hypothetical protein